MGHAKWITPTMHKTVHKPANRARDETRGLSMGYAIVPEVGFCSIFGSYTVEQDFWLIS